MKKALQPLFVISKEHFSMYRVSSYRRLCSAALDTSVLIDSLIQTAIFIVIFP